MPQNFRQKKTEFWELLKRRAISGNSYCFCTFIEQESERSGLSTQKIMWSFYFRFFDDLFQHFFPPKLCRCVHLPEKFTLTFMNYIRCLQKTTSGLKFFDTSLCKIKPNHVFSQNILYEFDWNLSFEVQQQNIFELENNNSFCFLHKLWRSFCLLFWNVQNSPCFPRTVLF